MSLRIAVVVDGDKVVDDGDEEDFMAIGDGCGCDDDEIIVVVDKSMSFSALPNVCNVVVAISDASLSSVINDDNGDDERIELSVVISNVLPLLLMLLLSSVTEVNSSTSVVGDDEISVTLLINNFIKLRFCNNLVMEINSITRKSC